MPRTLLVVDDIDTNRLILKKLLSGEYNILEASNGEEALRIMRREYRILSAVLLDLLMPGTDGFEVLRQVGLDDRLSQIPVIVTTGAAKEDSEVKALKLGCHDYISKPYNSVVIRQRLKNTINLRETAAAVNALQRDALTGLYTRELFFEKVRDKISQQRPGYYMFSCLDVDNFKVINDQYGMENGDLVLKHIAHCLDRYSYEMGGLTSRITADNFALIYPNTPENIKRMEKCHQVAVDAQMIGRIINIRIGRYVIDDLFLPVSAMYDRAMLAAECVRGMYGNYIARYNESMRDKLLQEQEIVFNMNSALKNLRFEVWFQPQFNHATGAIIGAEALTRWRDPQKGMIPPSVFIPVFERNGFIYELDKFVWDGACRYLRERLDAGKDPVRVSVNVSRVDALRPDFLEVLSAIIEKYDIPKELLHLEITESSFANSGTRLIAIVRRLIDMGFTIEIDDFGSGYSSLNTLKDVPATVLKLDMKFLDSDGDTKRGGNIVESVVRMAKWLGMSVIAEGVETREHADFLKSIGCNYVQGFLYSRPMTARAFDELSVNWEKQKKTNALETVESLDNNAFWDPSSIDTKLFNNYIGGACVLEYYGDTIDLIRANDKFAAMIGGAGFTAERALNLDWKNILGAENRAALVASIKHSIKTGEEVTREYVFERLPASADSMYIMTTLRVIASCGGRYLAYCVNEDVTSLRQAERAATYGGDWLWDNLRVFGADRDMTKLRSAFERLKLVTDTIPGGIASYEGTRSGLRLTYCSEGYYAPTGYTKYEYTDLADGDPVCLVFREDLHVIFEAVERVFDGDDDFSYEYRAKRKDGGFCWLRIQGVVVGRGRDMFTANVVKYDITEQKKTEEQLRIKNEEMRLALCEMGKTVFLYDVPSREIAVPTAYAISHGLDRGGEYIPSTALFALCPAEGDAEAFKEFFDNIDAGTKRGSTIVYMALPDGTTRLESAESITIFDDEARPARAIISVEDITDRRREFEQITSDREYQARIAAEYKRLFADASDEMYSHIIKIDLDTRETYKIEFVAGKVRQTGLNVNWEDYYRDFLSRTHPDDREIVREKTADGDLDKADIKSGIKIIYRCVMTPSDSYRWYSTVMRVSSFEPEPPLSGERVKRFATAFTVDITNDMLERARLTDLSEHDGLTDLYNRVKYSEMLETRYRTMTSCGVLFFDVNEMKMTNDTFGHEAGDALLRAVTDGIRSITSRRVHAYRFGGDEFMVVVCDADPKELDQLISMWAERQEAVFKNLGITGSVAVGKAFSRAPYAIDALINEADRNMYANKAASREAK